MPELMNLVGGLAPATIIGLFALPSYLGVLKQKGLLGGLFILLTLSLLAIGLNTLVIKSGLLYKDFIYADALGYRLFDITPWSIGLAYPALLLSAFWLASKLTKRRGRLILTATFLLITGLVFSPALFKLGLWQAEAADWFHGAPLNGFAVLAAFGLLGGWALIRLWGRNRVGAPVAYSGLAMLLFWSGVNIGVEQWLSVGVGLLASFIVLGALVAEKGQTRRRPG